MPEHYKSWAPSLNKSLNPGDHFSIATQYAMDMASNPWGVLWAITDWIALGSAAALPFTIIALFGTMLFFIYRFIREYRQTRQHVENNQEFFRLAHIKLLAADLYIAEHQELPRKAKSITDKVGSPRRHSKGPSIEVGMTASFNLFTTFFCGTAAILESLGMLALASSMLTPVGIVIAAVVAVGLGVYFGYKHYKISQHNHTIENKKTEMMDEIQRKQNQCYKLRGKEKTQRVTTTPNNAVVYSMTRPQAGFFRALTISPNMPVPALHHRRYSL